MRFGLRVLVVTLPSLLLAIACVGGENQCLNPQPDLPSCGVKNNNGSGGAFTSGAGTGDNDGIHGGGSGQTSSPTGAGGATRDPNTGVEAPTPNESAGSSGALEGGAGGGDSGGEAAGSAGESGAAGSHAIGR